MIFSLNLWSSRSDSIAQPRERGLICFSPTNGNPADPESHVSGPDPLEMVRWPRIRTRDRTTFARILMRNVFRRLGGILVA